MPAYRSSAEAEIRDAVVDCIRQHRPDSRIIHEINVSTYGPNRIDLVAVGKSEIIAVEIKSAKDKLDRLDAQLRAMARVAHHSIYAIHEKFLVEYKTNKHAAHYERGGEYFLKDFPEGLRNGLYIGWVYPEANRSVGIFDNLAKWRFPDAPLQIPTPPAALDMLWREELLWLCSKLRVSVGKRPNMTLMSTALRWNCNGRDLTLGICEALRRRQCVEADPIIEAA